MSRPLRVQHVITGLSVGGAETMLHKLLSGTDRSRFECTVVSLTDVGVVGERIRALGVPVLGLGMRRGRPDPVHILRLASRLTRAAPDVVQTWMYHADLAGGLAAKLAGGTPVVWGIRHSRLDPALTRRTTLVVARLCAALSSSLPEAIVCCSESSRLEHMTAGYDGTRMVVIPNGFDPAVFHPDERSRQELRAELGIAADATIIGYVARFDPQKNHRGFFVAARELVNRQPRVRFLLCGDGISWENGELVGYIEDSGLGGRCHLLGRRDDMSRVHAACDIASLASLTEGFPNALGEAMACGVPCVATAVGDVARILGETGKLVPPGDPVAMARSWESLIAMGVDGRRALGRAARSRVIERFSLGAVVRQYEKLYSELAGHVWNHGLH